MKKFEGDLGKPRKPIPKPGLLATKEDFDRYATTLAAEELAKLDALCRHYKIPAGIDKYFSLALALARDFVPAFQEQQAVGRKQKWTYLNKAVLVVELERIRDQKGPGAGYGITWAAKQLANREPWKSFLEHKESEASDPAPEEVLRRTYYSFKDNKWAIVARDAYGFHIYNEEIHKWNEFVDDVVTNPVPSRS